MNDKVKRIIEVLSHHTDLESISVLEELGTNAADNEVREFAKEQVLATLTPEERNNPMAYSQKVSAYIRTMAKNAGYKLQYHQVYFRKFFLYN